MREARKREEVVVWKKRYGRREGGKEAREERDVFVGGRMGKEGTRAWCGVFVVGEAGTESVVRSNLAFVKWK
jgi:hypothetical protein